MIRQRIIRIAVLILLFHLFSAELSHGQKYVVDSKTLFNFAKKSFEDKDFNISAGEFKRFIFYFPENENVPLAKYYIVLNLFQSGKYKESEKRIRALTEDLIKDDKVVVDKNSLIFKSYILLSKICEKQGKIQIAVNELRNLLMISENDDLRDLIFYKTAILFFNYGMFEKAAAVLKKTNKNSKLDKSIRTLENSVVNSSDIDSKSPVLAGFFSIVPGGGYLYTGRYKDAFVSFIFNGLLIYAACEAFDSGNEGLGALISFVETGFYLGNIYGGYNSARKYNNFMMKRYIEKEKKRVNIVLYPSASGKAVLTCAVIDF